MKPGQIEVTEKDTSVCRFCNALIAWQVSRSGRKYPTEVNVLSNPAGNLLVTSRTWFHSCKEREAVRRAGTLFQQPSVVPQPEEPSTVKYEPNGDSQAARKRAMQAYLEGASRSKLLEALWVLFQRQTAMEQSMEATTDQNGVGFTGVDADMLSSISKRAKQYGGLTEKQGELIRKKLKKYARQLVAAYEAGEWQPN